MFSLTIFIQRYYRTIIDILLVVLALYLGLRLLGFLYSIAAPLFWSFVIFLMIEPFARFLNRKGLRKGLATTISTFSFIILILAFVTVLGLFLTNQVASLIEKFRVTRISFSTKSQVRPRTYKKRCKIFLRIPSINFKNLPTT
ncbi:AI-2E family transporter [Paenibacillus larvae]|uniref:AI-2E family transporter n=1 Tax=Paenibacillus larvae TaxID=1464 RepID=UPI00288FD2C9|nr:AI-2E family transporter [Paenibacillus larvae]MDT2193201.1 AI-2E family transporter [Paenibacillus larvae]